MQLHVFVIIVICSVVAMIICEDRTCEEQSECPADECCVFIHVYMSSQCKKLRKKGFFCFPDSEQLVNDGKYRLICPCESTLTCRSESIKKENGVTVYHNSTCQEK